MSIGIKQKTDKKKVKGVADVVFCFDCTASMQPYIDQVKYNVNALVAGFDSNNNIVLDWQVRAMGYRDFNVDTEKLINHHPFVKDANEFTQQLNQLAASGGADEPESTIDAIWYAIKKTSWRERAHKVVVLFTDATPLPVHDDTITDLGIGTGDIDYLKQELKTQKIKLFMFCKTDPVYKLFNDLPKAQIVQYDDPETQLATSDFKKLLEQIGATVSEESSSVVL
jgi:hypothetical protein